MPGTKKTAGYILLLAAMFGFQISHAQKDPEAKKILDRVSARSLAEYPIRVSFEYIYEDLMVKETSTRKGTLVIEENKFRLSIGESTVYCDGITVWNHNLQANEVYVSDAEEEASMDEFFISSPNDLFTFYQEGFKYRKTGEVDYQGNTYYEIDIFPEDLGKNYHTIKLLIDRKDDRIYSAEAFGKNAENHTVILTGYSANISTDEKTFVFDPADHPGVEIIDTRL
jgi:hypothetical protein